MNSINGVSSQIVRTHSMLPVQGTAQAAPDQLEAGRTGGRKRHMCCPPPAAPVFCGPAPAPVCAPQIPVQQCNQNRLVACEPVVNLCDMSAYRCGASAVSEVSFDNITISTSGCQREIPLMIDVPGRIQNIHLPTITITGGHQVMLRPVINLERDQINVTAGCVQDLRQHAVVGQAELVCNVAAGAPACPPAPVCQQAPFAKEAPIGKGPELPLPTLPNQGQFLK